MWIFLNDAFFSVVDQRAKFTGKETKKPSDKDLLVVRARMDGDLEKVFPGVPVKTDKGTDYKYRVTITRKRLKEVMAKEIERITYGNFKDSTDTKLRHDAYMSVWGVMYRLQEPRRRAKAAKEPDYYGEMFEGL